MNLELIIISSLFCTGIFTATRNGMILSWIKTAYLKMIVLSGLIDVRFQKFIEFLKDPLFDCLYCMSSFWVIVLWCIYGFEFHPVELIISILCTCGMNTLIVAMVFKDNPGTE